MERSQRILDFFSYTKRGLVSEEDLDCTLTEFCDYLQQTEFDRTSLGAYLKINLKKYIDHYFEDKISYELFMSSSAFQLLKNVWFDQDLLKNKAFFKSNLERYISYAIVEEIPNDMSGMSTDQLIGKANCPYNKDNNELHQRILSYSPTSSDTIQLVCTREMLEQTNWSNTPLVLACKTGNTFFALELIKQHHRFNVGLNVADSLGMTALHWACFFRDDSLILALLEAGADISCLNDKKQMPLDLYQYQMPVGMSIVRHDKRVGGFCHLPGIAAISDGSNRFFSMQTGAHEKLADCTIDILFHMDKIAMHQLNVSLSRLVIELQRAKYNSINSNGLFEIYTYYHFENFVWARNRKHCSPAIIERLKINVDVEEASGVALSQQQELYGLLTDLQIETSHFMASSSQEQSQLLAQQIQLEITVKQFCENPSHEGLERAIWVTEQFDHQLEPQPDAWNKVHPILKCILGVLSLITLVPAVIVELTTSQGYINTFFKNESKKIQSVSDVPESSPDLGYKSER